MTWLIIAVIVLSVHAAFSLAWMHATGKWMQESDDAFRAIADYMRNGVNR